MAYSSAIAFGLVMAGLPPLWGSAVTGLAVMRPLPGLAWSLLLGGFRRHGHEYKENVFRLCAAGGITVDDEAVGNPANVTCALFGSPR